MKVSALWLVVALAVGLAIGIFAVPKSSGGDSSQTAMVINGEKISIDELIGSYVIRPKLSEFIEMKQLAKLIEREGIELNPARAEEVIQTKKDFLITQGISYEEELQRIRMTEDEVLLSTEYSIVSEDQARSIMAISDTKIEEYWNLNQDLVKRKYLSQNQLPQTADALEKVTLESARDIIKKDLEDALLPSVMQEFRARLLSGAELSLPVIKEPERRKLLEDLLINFAKRKAQEQLPEMEKARLQATGLSESEGSVGNSVPMRAND